jgi:hypothetical protein
MNLLDLPDRLQSKILPEPNSGCWIWMGALSEAGYGRDWNSRAHRVTYEALRGPIPDGMVLDHKCRTRCCVNPDHLEPVTDRENLMRGNTPARKNAEKTHCKRGHEFTPKNTRVSMAGSGTKCRVCRECARRRDAAYFKARAGS